MQKYYFLCFVYHFVFNYYPYRFAFVVPGNIGQLARVDPKQLRRTHAVKMLNKRLREDKDALVRGLVVIALSELAHEDQEQLKGTRAVERLINAWRKDSWGWVQSEARYALEIIGRAGARLGVLPEKINNTDSAAIDYLLNLLKKGEEIKALQISRELGWQKPLNRAEIIIGEMEKNITKSKVLYGDL